MSYRTIWKTFGGLACVSAVGVGLTAIGCGGAGGSGSTGPLGGQTEAAGQAQISFTGRPKAMATSSSGMVSAVAQAGVTYTSLNIYPPLSLASTYLAFSRGGINGELGDSQIYTIPIAGAASPVVLFPSSLSNRYPTWSRPGVLAFESWATKTNWNLDTILPDGTGVGSVVSATTSYIPSIAPNESAIVYVSGTNTLWSTTIGGTPQKIYTAPTGETLAQSPVVWSPDNTKVAFSLYSGSTTQIFILTLATGSAVQVIPQTGAGSQLVPNSWSPDGTTLACTDYALANVVLVNLSTDGFAEITPTSAIDSVPTFSPDGQKIAFYRTGNAYAHGIYICDFNGENPQLFLADPSSAGTAGPITGLFWSPFPQKKTFVGSGGVLSSTASGFLLSQNGSQFASLLAFTAKTPSTAAISSPTATQSGSPLIFTITADSISSAAYANSYYGSDTYLVTLNAPSLLVSIDGLTGQIDLFVPAVVLNKSASQGAKGGDIYTGQFPAIYDGAGKNIAPTGATSIQIDSSTGKLLSFH